jgi:hypothetical protein
MLPLICSSANLVPMVDIGPSLFHDPSLPRSYQGYPHPTPNTTNVCLVTSDGVEIPDAPPSGDSLSHSFTPSLTQEILPEEPPLGESVENQPPVGQIPIWKIVPQAITQIPFFYPPLGVTTYQVVANLTLPNMVIAIPIWYLDDPDYFRHKMRATI